MVNAVPSRTGQINQAGDALALYLKVFAGEVLTNFHRNNVFLERSMVRTISSGKSAQFPAMGNITAAYHTVGAEILGTSVPHAERLVNIDDLLVASAFLANIDEAMNHYELRSAYSEEMGMSLAEQMDSNIAQVGLLAARATGTVTGAQGTAGGTSLVNATYSTDSAVLAAGMFAASQVLDEKNIPQADRNAFLRPAQYYLLAQNTTAINSWFGGKGAYSEGTILKIGGLEIVKTNALPSTNVTTGVTAYRGNFSTTVGLVMNKQAVGTVKLLDLATESQYDIRRQGTLLVAKYAVGHGIIRPECAVELRTAVV